MDTFLYLLLGIILILIMATALIFLGVLLIKPDLILKHKSHEKLKFFHFHK